MPSIEWNRRMWNDEYDWETTKPGWCHPTIGNDVFWHFGLLPRIHEFVPAGRILEIAPGHGRWTEFLKDLSTELVAVDLNENCIKACQERFAGAKNIRYHVNDGKSLDVVPDRSLDFVFSFDSLVHCDLEVIAAYITALSAKLADNGVAFLHHSNAAACKPLPAPSEFAAGLQRLAGAKPGKEKDPIRRGGRGQDVSAAKVEALCMEAKLCCVTQELITWNSPLLIDSLTTIARRGSRWARPNRVFENPDFLPLRQQWQKTMRPYVYRIVEDGD